MGNTSNVRPASTSLASADCDVAFDNLTRQLYATDASIYQIEPVAVAFPRSARQASSAIQAAANAGVSVIPRGAGSGLAGGAIGDGLIVEFSLYARHQRDGLPLRERLLSKVDLLGRLGTLTPRLANAALEFEPLRELMAKLLGISAERPLPPYANQRFDRWFGKRTRNPASRTRGRVILWDDTFVRYHEPHIGVAAVRVLEALGFEVLLLKGRACCGRPAFSQGNLDEAARLGSRNIRLLRAREPRCQCSSSSLPVIRCLSKIIAS